jgi:hypothetical protein
MLTIFCLNTADIASVLCFYRSSLFIFLSWKIITGKTPTEDANFIRDVCCPYILPQTALTIWGITAGRWLFEQPSNM